MSTKSYLKFRTIRGTPQKWVGFGKPLFVIHTGKFATLLSRLGSGFKTIPFPSSPFPLFSPPIPHSLLPCSQAYLEFFTNPAFVEQMLEVLRNYPSVNYHIVNREVCTLRCVTDIVQFCGFSLCNSILTRTDTIANSLLVLTLSEIVVIKAG